MALQPEFAIFRSFQALNIQNLLYLQAEIAHLEDEIGFIAGEDMAREGCQYHTQDWWSLSQGDDSEESTRQWEKWLELREVLEKYNETLIKVSQIVHLEKPREYDIQFLKSCPSGDHRRGISSTLLFAALFSLALVVMTNGRMIEVFAATAAFAAVNVVFLTNDNGTA
ncbi:hypothetical protein ACHAQA_004192 [Verticillium albo-atrum]